MKIGIFDSGLGGLLVLRSLAEAYPEYDYLYYGDTARVPYGNRSQETVYRFTCEALEFFFGNGCRLVILACNTASAEALRRIQQEFLPARFPDRKVLGVLIPAAEEAVARSREGRIGILATASTVQSGAYPREIRKLMPEAEVCQNAAPLLVPLVEHDGLKWAEPILAEYLAPLLYEKVDTLVLGCTHYPYLKEMIRHAIGPDIALVSQDELLPEKFADYLSRHPEIAEHLSRGGTREYWVTDMTPMLVTLSERLFGESAPFKKVP